MSWVLLLLGALVGLVCCIALGWIAYSALFVPRQVPLLPAASGAHQTLDTAAGRVSFYQAGPPEGRPLLLIHSVNAAASAYEVRPLFEHYKAFRPVYALELPGYGFSEAPDIPEALRQARADGRLEVDLDPDTASYFLSRASLHTTPAPGMARWRKALFVHLAHNAANPADYFALPASRTVVMGSQVDV